MPWKEKTPMSEKKEFVLEAFGRDLNMSELCRKYGISRKTGYKWKERFEKQGEKGLEERSRAAYNHPNQVSREVEMEIVRVRSSHSL
ncbi:MAG: hypothetical protein Kow0090_20480 [Myxococcota bacterium]